MWVVLTESKRPVLRRAKRNTPPPHPPKKNPPIYISASSGYYTGVKFKKRSEANRLSSTLNCPDICALLGLYNTYPPSTSLASRVT